MPVTKSTTKTDQDKFFQERNAATHMRDDLFFLVGWVKADNPDIAKRLEEILENHDKNRVGW
tara:strand:+ start:807 stop:992 length:186 start_codon:yes stop_codon:yes gene_type:complete